MKKFIYIISCAAALAASVSCAKLDLNPPSAASSENWYSTSDEIRISLNDFYRTYLYDMHTEYFFDRRCDDWAQRETRSTICAMVQLPPHQAHIPAIGLTATRVSAEPTASSKP